MYRLLLVLLISVFSAADALSDVDAQCIADNSEPWSNDNLIGTWYRIWRFELFGGMVPSSECTERTFTKPSEEVIEEYKNKYNDPDQPFNIDDNPVLVYGEMTVDGMVMGHGIAKYYVLSPNSTMTLGWTNYKVDAYRLLTPKFIMYTPCELRGFTRWLLTTDRYADVAEIEELIKNTPELNRLGQQRYCATY